ncbi:unnamed protein product [Schistosoma margrebowiei]|uniref:Uncharacterized protein n=1 Tax=Schistosoma margrebowiei TaxID=48269 RepID=A0A183MV35_9TREM|nr:unnamed protein product [Schistosoma margrebowiei]
MATWTDAYCYERRIKKPRQLRKPFSWDVNSFHSNPVKAFTDIFDEETFYIFFICLVILSFIIAFSIAKYFDVTIKDADHLKLTKRQKTKRHYSINQQK